MRVIVRAFTKDGYHKDIANLSEKQVHMSYDGMDKFKIDGVMGVSVVIDPKDFPEMVEFQVAIEDDRFK